MAQIDRLLNALFANIHWDTVDALWKREYDERVKATQTAQTETAQMETAAAKKRKRKGSSQTSQKSDTSGAPLVSGSQAGVSQGGPPSLRERPRKQPAPTPGTASGEGPRRPLRGGGTPSAPPSATTKGGRPKGRPRKSNPVLQPAQVLTPCVQRHVPSH